MLKAMIVDDEPLVRLGLESMIKWEELGYTLVPCATNGQEGLDHIIHYRPDIVITDIKMPIMDGIQMIEKCKARGINIKFIVLSSYDEFNLVKQVMKLGAMDYLIKLNLNEKELSELLIKLREELSENAKEKSKDEELKQYLISNKKTLKQDFIRKLMLGMIDLKDKKSIRKDIKGLGMNENLTYALNCIRLVKPETKQEAQMNDMTSFYLVNMCQDTLSNFGKGYVFLRTEKELIVFVELNKAYLTDEVLYKEFIGSLGEKLLQMIKQYFNKMAVIGVSRVYDNLLGLNDAFKESMEAVKLIITDEKLPIYFYSDQAKQDAKNCNKVDILDLKESLIAAMDTGDEKLLNELFETIYDRFNHCVSRQNAYEICYKLVYIVTVLGPNGEMIIKETFDKDYTEFENIQAFTTIGEVVLWIKKLQSGISQFINQKYLDVANIKVKKAKQYINQNIYVKMTLPEVAEKLEISSGYLSTIFKKVEGKSFSDYVAEVKISEAKKLLKEDNYKIYEVSAKLGYDDPYYFSKLFKKVASMTPTEFMCKG
ncbi:response regulator [Cellulosilyticum sp. I15G10I2]|uniref:response regulator n=1 Tax=Cellulosilyticum sp. I15G10I2 TaxID=1892843 RepID=UPI00085C2061|nr:response regulator [Cellulosilyticum sp. I15G10I2]